MIEEMYFNEKKDYLSNNISLEEEDDINSQSNSEIYSFSKEIIKNGNEYFESEFKKVFNEKDSFGESRKEEEKDLETEKNDEIRLDKKKIFKLIYNANKYVNKKNATKAKKIFTIFDTNNYNNYSYDELILYIKNLNSSFKTSSSISNKYRLLKLEHKLILELKTRLLNQIKETENI